MPESGASKMSSYGTRPCKSLQVHGSRRCRPRRSLFQGRSNFLKLQKWKKEFEQRNGRQPNKADIMLADPEIMGLARRLGEFQ